MAKGIKKTEQKKIPRYFEKRTNWLTKSGAMPIKFSSKRQTPNIHATLRVVDEVAALAATGGTRTALSGSMAVPFSKAQPNKSTREVLNPARMTLPKSKWPTRITGKGTGKRSRGKSRKVPKPFYMTSTGTGRKYVVKRTSKEDDSLSFLYGFKRTVKVEKQWPLVENAQAYLDRNFQRRFRVELFKAMKSAR